MRDELRSEMTRRVRSLSPDRRALLSGRACENVIGMDEYDSARSVMAFFSLRSEIDTGPLLSEILSAGKVLVLPACGDGGGCIVPRIVEDMHKDLLRGAHHIMEPSALCPAADIASIDMVVVPGRVFDRLGNRIGFGGGCYDRFLAEEELGARTERGTAVRVGLAFSFQLVERLSPETHDVPVDFLVTEDGVTDCR